MTDNIQSQDEKFQEKARRLAHLMAAGVCVLRPVDTQLVDRLAVAIEAMERRRAGAAQEGGAPVPALAQLESRRR
jgi:hypothetical protein